MMGQMWQILADSFHQWAIFVAGTLFGSTVTRWYLVTIKGYELGNSKGDEHGRQDG